MPLINTFTLNVSKSRSVECSIDSDNNYWSWSNFVVLIFGEVSGWLTKVNNREVRCELLIRRLFRAVFFRDARLKWIFAIPSLPPGKFEKKKKKTMNKIIWPASSRYFVQRKKFFEPRLCHPHPNWIKKSAVIPKKMRSIDRKLCDCEKEKCANALIKRWLKLNYTERERKRAGVVFSCHQALLQK